ncbi:hypothetical protein AD006_27830 [Pseudonocardia sp. EC080610-09]|uniref:hypothetical protein n=1 Tax=unclassified Pseudonocardia TaxID=2619320 RepID=UPI0006CB772F|nr:MULTISPECIES: hypothetical protein [unclassified Pseudonocardia]ALE74726.1 hypothetical protein FRP1_20415 [Pseudonocardia sp. EC080625-04]ALL78158.1 hypothetical protein AD006_27830 [Pseudonocardia sp. EC080610-09]ALL81070.1 hypothetical protein AD017_07425 [Pseudonocardia sp. EC080619-01]
MRLQLLAKDNNSGEVGCPSVHRDLDSGGLVFQGPAVEMRLLPNALPGEQAVLLEPEIVRRAAAALGWL